MDAFQVRNNIAHGLVSLRDVLFQALFHNLPQRPWNRFVERLERPDNDGLQQLEIGIASKRLSVGQQFIQHDAKGKDVTARVDWFS